MSFRTKTQNKSLDSVAWSFLLASVPSGWLPSPWAPPTGGHVGFIHGSLFADEWAFGDMRGDGAERLLPAFLLSQKRIFAPQSHTDHTHTRAHTHTVLVHTHGHGMPVQSAAWRDLCARRSQGSGTHCGVCPLSPIIRCLERGAWCWGCWEEVATPGPALRAPRILSPCRTFMISLNANGNCVRGGQNMPRVLRRGTEGHVKTTREQEAS